MWYESEAPSNIALIKYMGKIDQAGNKPTNSSLSYTLDHLKTFVRIRLNNNLTQDHWAPYIRNDLKPIELSVMGKEKFLNHFKMLKSEFQLLGFYNIESANNFSSDCGLASSASSFAALTKATYSMANKNLIFTNFELSKLSRKGSGSSCRSFFSPWAIWKNDEAEPIDLPFGNLFHLVVLCDESVKSVSSSEAHKRVLTSDLFIGRPERAETRFKNIIENLQSKNWKNCFKICWNEFWDMHTLFHTSDPAFIYINASAQKALNDCLLFWNQQQDGPIVTMDAGSNIHLLFRDNQLDLINFYKNYFSANHKIWFKDN